jgi:hypothetical protein
MDAHFPQLDRLQDYREEGNSLQEQQTKIFRRFVYAGRAHPNRTISPQTRPLDMAELTFAGPRDDE